MARTILLFTQTHFVEGHCVCAGTRRSAAAFRFGELGLKRWLVAVVKSDTRCEHHWRALCFSSHLQRTRECGQLGNRVHLGHVWRNAGVEALELQLTSCPRR